MAKTITLDDKNILTSNAKPCTGKELSLLRIRLPAINKSSVTGYTIRKGFNPMAEKNSKQITKRKSKSERTHIRRMKQEARNDPLLLTVKK